MLQKHTILVVDDENSIIEFIVNILQDRYTIKVASNGVVALKILQKFPIDLVLLDIQMPVLNGYETIKQMKTLEILQKIPVVFLTSKNDRDSLIHGFQLGAKDYITKPFNAQELKVRVDNHIETFELIKKLENSYANLKKFIDKQDNIVILTDGKKLQFANKSFFNFLGFETLEYFFKEHECICEFFIQNDKFFHLGKIEDKASWIDEMDRLEESQRIVSMMGNKFTPHAFAVGINQYDEKIKIVSFTDISQTIIKNITLENKTTHDKLTSAYNREFLEQNNQKIITECKEKGSYLAVAFLDIDHFKIVNDTFGHDVGDIVLKEFVDTIHKYSRDEDVLIRWGGEEFILLLQVNSTEDLYRALEHLRHVIEKKKFTTIGKKTCSIGGTLYREKEDIQKAIKRADEAVYDAKAAGRNRVVIF